MNKSLKTIKTEQAIKNIMETPDGQRLAFLCYYDWSAEIAYKRFQESEEWIAIRKILSSFQLNNNKVLDFGSGNGISSFAFAKDGYDVFSLEPDPSSLVGYGALSSSIRKLNLPIKQISAYGEYLPFKSSFFGLAYCRQVLHHSLNLNLMLSEITRVLIPNGILIATREHVIDDENSKDEFLRNHALHKYTKSENAFQISTYLEAAESAGLKIIKVLLPYDSVINHYPTSNNEVKEKFRRKIEKKLGILSKLIPITPTILSYYRNYLSKNDTRPGRMISFIAKKK